MTTLQHRHTTVLLSGGIDSTAVLALAAEPKSELEKARFVDTLDAVTIDYGQTHATEIDAARRVAAHYGIPHTVIDVSTLRATLASPLTGHGPIPTADPATGPAATYVPNRNMILLAIAAAHAHTTARRHGAAHAYLHTGIHADDTHGYPDCTPAFNEYIGEAVRHATPEPHVALVTPFASASKTVIVKVGTKAAAPFHLTWSCYRGGTRHCGTCTTCIARVRAFTDADVPDPADYDIDAAQAATALAALDSAHITTDGSVAPCGMCGTASHITGDITTTLNGNLHRIATWGSCINTACTHHGLTCTQASCDQEA